MFEGVCWWMVVLLSNTRHMHVFCIADFTTHTSDRYVVDYAVYPKIHRASRPSATVVARGGDGFLGNEFAEGFWLGLGLNKDSLVFHRLRYQWHDTWYFAIPIVASSVALGMFEKQFNQTYHSLSKTIIDCAWAEHSWTHTANIIVTNTNQPVVLCNTDAELSVIMVWLQVIGKAYWRPSRRGTIWPFLDPYFTKKWF